MANYDIEAVDKNRGFTLILSKNLDAFNTILVKHPGDKENISRNMNYRYNVHTTNDLNGEREFNERVDKYGLEPWLYWSGFLKEKLLKTSITED